MNKQMIAVKGRNTQNATKVLVKINLFNPTISKRQAIAAKKRLGINHDERLVLAEDYNCIVVQDKNGFEIDLIP